MIYNMMMPPTVNSSSPHYILDILYLLPEAPFFHLLSSTHSFCCRFQFTLLDWYPSVLTNYAGARSYTTQSFLLFQLSSVNQSEWLNSSTFSLPSLLLLVPPTLTPGFMVSTLMMSSRVTAVHPTSVPLLATLL